MTVYKNMTRPELDAAYDNTNAVCNSAELLADFDKRSLEIRTQMPQLVGLRYGDGERQLIDYFKCGAPNAPVLVFIHGGYWQMRAKETFTFIAKGPLERGFDVAFAGYTLAPQKTLGGIVEEVKEAISFINAMNAKSGSAGKLIVSGWSAGGHLAAMCLNEPNVAAAISISGIFELEPISLCYLNDKLNLSPADIESLSPMRLPYSDKPLVAICGENELPELKKQTLKFAKARAQNHKPGGAYTLPRHNHFTILEELASPQGTICNMLKPALDWKH